jgi:hypothetical protein
LAAFMAISAAVGWSTAVPTPVSGTVTSIGHARSDVRLAFPLDTLSAGSVTTFRNRDPFRVDHTPARARFDPWASAHQQSVPPPPAPPRPALRLVGMIGGPPWTALVEGIPGREDGVLLRLGEEAGGIRMTRLYGDTVEFTGFDTTWALRARPTWQ